MAIEAKKSTRIYCVNAEGTKPMLVRAKTRAGALRFVARKSMHAEFANQDQIVNMITAGFKVDDATEEDES